MLSVVRTRGSTTGFKSKHFLRKSQPNNAIFGEFYFSENFIAYFRKTKSPVWFTWPDDETSKFLHRLSSSIAFRNNRTNAMESHEIYICVGLCEKVLLAEFFGSAAVQLSVHSRRIRYWKCVRGFLSILSKSRQFI